MYHHSRIRQTLVGLVAIACCALTGVAWADPQQAAPIPNQSRSHVAPDVLITLSPAHFTFTTASPISYTLTNTNPGVVGASEGGGVLTLSFTPGVTGNATVEVFAHQDGNTANYAFLVDVTNSAPVAIGPAAIPPFFEDDLISLAQSEFAFSDADGAIDNLTFSLGATSGPAVWTPVLIDADMGSVDFIPNAHANGTQTFNIIATDLVGASATWTFTLTANPVPDAPVVTTGVADQVMAEDEATRSVNVVGGFDDPDLAWEGDTLTVVAAVSSNPGLVTAVPSGTDVDLTPVANLSGGPVTIDVTVEDSTGNQATTSFTVTVDPANDPVTVAAGVADQAIAEDVGAVSVDITGAFADIDLANEGDSHTVTVTAISNGALAAATNSPIASLSGLLDFAITPNANGSATVTIEAEDAAGSTATTSFDIVVAPQNDPPFVTTGVADQLMTEDEATRTVDVVSGFDDADFAWEGDTLTVLSATSSDPALVAVAPNLGGVDLTPGADASGGPVTIDVTVRDVGGLQANTSFTVTVTAANDPVVLVGAVADQLVAEDVGTVSVDLTGVFDDLDLALEGDTHTVTVTLISNGALAAATNSPIATLSGLLDFAITPDANGTTLVTIEAEDAAGTTATTSFNIDVTPVNDPPFLAGGVADQAMTEDEATRSVEVVAEFDDVDFAFEGDTLTVVSAVSSAPGLLTAVPNGTTVDLTPVAEQSGGPVTVTVTVEDSNGAQASDTFDVTIGAANDPVVLVGAVADQLVAEDVGTVSVDLTGVFDDLDLALEGDTHTVTVTLISNGALAAATNSPIATLSGLLDFAITPDANGTTLVTIEAEDAAGTTATTSFNIDVTPVNDPPFLAGGVADQAMAEDEATRTVEVVAEFDDPDFAFEGDTLTVVSAVSSVPGLLTAVPNGTAVDLTPVAEQSGGPVTVTVTVEDSNGAQASDTFDVTIGTANDPVVVIGAIGDRLMNEDPGAFTVNLAGVFQDLDLVGVGDTHTVTVVGNSNPALVTPTNSPIADLAGALGFSVGAHQVGTSLITIRAVDAAGSTAEVSFNVDVAPVNDPPFVAATIADQVHAEDAGSLAVSFAGSFDDVDLLTEGDVQIYSFALDNAALATSASIAGTTITLDFGADQNGTVNVTVQVEDKAGLVASDTFAVAVAAVNDSPYVENPIGVIGVNEDAPDTVINLASVFNDIDIATNGDVLTYSVAANSDPSLFNSVSVSGNLLTLNYRNNQFGTATISVQARDSAGATVADTFTVNITEVFPIANNDGAVVDEDGGTITIDVLANDFLGEAPTLITVVGRNWPDPAAGPYFDVTNSDPTTVLDESGSSVTLPNGVLAVSGGQVLYTPKANFNGADWFEYVIQDADGDMATGVVNITVTPQPDAPRAFASPEYTVDQGSFLDILPAGGLASYAIDDDGDPLEVRLVSVPTHAISFVLDPSGDGSFTYTPDPAYGGNAGDSDSFVVYYWDEDDGLASVPVTVTIYFDPDDGPVAPPPPGEVEFDFDLADVPLEDAISAEANVLILMDDSGSMDWSVMTPESEGLFRITNSGVRNPGVQSATNSYQYVHHVTTNVYTGNLNVPTEEALAADPVFNGNNYGVWRARSAQYSSIYYNPTIRYTPWIGLDRTGAEFANADPTAAVLDPFDATVRTIDLTALHTFRSENVPAISTRIRDVINSNVYYPHYYETTATGSPAWNAPHSKITIDGTFPVVRADGSSINYYPGSASRADCAADDGDPQTCTYQQELQNFANWFTYYRSREYTAKAALGRSIAAASNVRMGYAALNDSNERERIDSLNASFRVGHKKEVLDQVYRPNSNGSTPLRAALNRAGRHFECRSGDSFGSASNSAPGDAACPVLASPEGQCQNNFTLLFSDGTWNGSFSGSNHDRSGGTDPSPSPFDGGMFADGYSGTLADIAMYYYERDLHPSLADGVPTTLRDQAWAPAGALSADGETMHQHMKTYTVGFGLTGTVSFADLPATYTTAFAWPDPFAQGLAKIDDMLHAAVNGRGQFLQANNPVLLSQAFSEAFEEFADGSVSVSAVAFNSTALREDTIEYRGFFNLKFNSGDLRALLVDSTTGAVDNANPIWRAAVQMDTINPITRKIVTWDDNAETGIPFVHGSLNADQQAVLDADELDWLRGVRSEEEPNGILRSREATEGMLGDIVHSAPVFVGAPRAFRRDQAPYPTSSLYSSFAATAANRNRVVYVAANDGMLHGFDAGTGANDYGTGDEVFAYVPNKIIDSSERFANELDQLTSLVYAHRYFVDLTPTVEDVYVRASSGAAARSWNTVLVGGLGGGGKGYFAINVSDPNNSYASIANAVTTPLWEFTDEDDTTLLDGGGNPILEALTGEPVKDLGYAFSQAQVVLTNVVDVGGNNEWMAVFGNGYNSTAGIAKLFLLNIDAGIDGWDAGDFTKIDTGEGVKSAPDPDAGLPNGLGTPALVDDNGDGTADRAYAGDLFGNLFRFDISDPNPANWTSTKVFQATFDGTQTTRQAITTQPYVFAHPDNGFMVVFGTGSYITEADGTSTDIESIYGIWDRDEVAPATATADAKFTRLVEQTVTNLVDETNAVFERLRIVTGNDVAYVPDSGTPGVYGWYIDLDMERAEDTIQGNPNPDSSGNPPPAVQYPGERAIRRIIARGDSLLITTVIPRDANTCFRSPPGSTFPIDALTGGNPRRAILDTNNDGVVDSDDLIEYNGEFYAAGILFDTDDLDGTLVDPSLLVGRGDEDFLFLSGGDDQVTLRIAGPTDPKTGRLSWRELDDAQ